MGKSDKKSSTKVEEALVKSTKPLKKGKRAPEDDVDTKVSLKKQKKDVIAPVKKEKSSKKVPKKVESSDSSDSSESEEEEKPKKVSAKKAPVKAASSSDEDSSSSEDEPAPKKKVVASTNGKVAKKTKDESSSEEDSSDDESSDEEVAVAKKPAAKNVSVKAKAESSSSEEESSDEDEEPAKKPAVAAKAASKDSSSSDDDSESEDEKPAVKKAAASASSSSDSSSEEESEEEKPVAKKAKAAKKESSSDESSEEESEDEKETPKKKVQAMLICSYLKSPKTPSTPAAGGQKTLFAANLSFQIERADVENFFKEAGQVVDVRFATSRDDGTFRGFGHVEFASAEEAQKALEMNGRPLLGRDIRLDLAQERGERPAYTPQSGNGNFRSGGGGGGGTTVFVKGFDSSLPEDDIKHALSEHFASCGEISRVSVPMDRDRGCSKGIAYVDFKDSADKAYELDGSDMGGWSIVVNEARPRESSGFGSERGGGRDFGGRSGGRDFGGRRGGRSGGRDGGRRGGRSGGRDSGRFGNRPSITPTGTKTTFDD
ncbi:unnamed protein product [Cochlearia groenlandica]